VQDEEKASPGQRATARDGYAITSRRTDTSSIRSARGIVSDGPAAHMVVDASGTADKETVTVCGRGGPWSYLRGYAREGRSDGGRG